MDDEELDSAFAKLLGVVGNPPDEHATFLGYSMRDWLRNTVADPGTSVDTGGGFGSFDLWVTVGGVEFYIEIKKSAAQRAKENPVP